MDQAQQLRNIIKKQNLERHVARVITVTSGKGGVGKTSISVNLAIQLRRLGNRVVILDADFGLANIEVLLGVRPQYNLADLMFKGKPLKDIITIGPENIGFISGGSGIQELTNLNKDQIVYLVQTLYELDDIADVIIIDTGAGISDAVLEFVMTSSEVLLVATPEPTSITDAYALLKTLNRKPEFFESNTSVKMISNRIGSLEEGKELYTKLRFVVDKFLDIKLEYLGSVPQDGNLSKAVMQQKPVSVLYPNTGASRALQDIAIMINEDSMVNKQNKKGIAQLFSDMIRRKFAK